MPEVRRDQVSSLPIRDELVGAREEEAGELARCLAAFGHLVHLDTMFSTLHRIKEQASVEAFGHHEARRELVADTPGQDHS